MMLMIRRVIIGDLLAAGTEHGMNVAAALEERLQVGTIFGQLRFLRAIDEGGFAKG